MTVTFTKSFSVQLNFLSEFISSMSVCLFLSIVFVRFPSLDRCLSLFLFIYVYVGDLQSFFYGHFYYYYYYNRILARLGLSMGTVIHLIFHSTVTSVTSSIVLELM